MEVLQDSLNLDTKYNLVNALMNELRNTDNFLTYMDLLKKSSNRSIK